MHVTLLLWRLRTCGVCNALKVGTANVRMVVFLRPSHSSRNCVPVNPMSALLIGALVPGKLIDVGLLRNS